MKRVSLHLRLLVRPLSIKLRQIRNILPLYPKPVHQMGQIAAVGVLTPALQIEEEGLVLVGEGGEVLKLTRQAVIKASKPSREGMQVVAEEANLPLQVQLEEIETLRNN